MVHVLVFLISVFISSVSQILLKISANKKHDNKVKEYLNAMVIVAYIMFILSSLLTILAYRGIPLSWGPILETSGYIWVALLGVVLLKEKINLKKGMGLGIVMLGIVFCVAF